MYEEGRGGLPQDYTEAMKWYQKAADSGHESSKQALMRLGVDE